MSFLNLFDGDNVYVSGKFVAAELLLRPSRNLIIPSQRADFLPQEISPLGIVFHCKSNGLAIGTYVSRRHLDKKKSKHLKLSHTRIFYPQIVLSQEWRPLSCMKVHISVGHIRAKTKLLDCRRQICFQIVGRLGKYIQGFCLFFVSQQIFFNKALKNYSNLNIKKQLIVGIATIIAYNTC